MDKWVFYGAEDVIRTRDLLITNQLLYQLSYSSILNFNATYCLGFAFRNGLPYEQSETCALRVRCSTN